MEITMLHKPLRGCLIRRGVKAAHYFDYCEEVGCDIWDTLVALAGPEEEPVCLWLPQTFVAPGTSVYVQGVEVPADYDGPVPNGFDLITLPEADYLRFQGEPFVEETFGQAIEEVWAAMERFDPAIMDCEWDDENPRIQLEPRCERGYVEMRAVRKKS